MSLSLQNIFHLIFEILAYSLGAQYYFYLRKKEGDLISSEHRFWIFFAAAMGGWIGSRLIAALEDPALFFNPSTPALYYLSSKTVLGGLVGGWGAIECVKKILQVKSSSGDLMTRPLLLSMIIGRVGCLFAGIEDRTYGRETQLPWGMNLGDGLKRHPTNLYEIFFLILTWIFLNQLEKKYTLKNGIRFKIFIGSYCLFRFLIEFLKPVHPLWMGLSAIQWTALIALLCLLPYWIGQKDFMDRRLNVHT